LAGIAWLTLSHVMLELFFEREDDLGFWARDVAARK
jgi:hypothetical protein